MDHRPSTETSGAVPHFYGREEELARLYGLFDDVGRRRRVPCLAVIVAESGIGKSALVQALYRKLTTDPRWDGPSPSGFWPDAFQGSGHHLEVNPDFPEGYQPGTRPKFMWLGIRWPNPDDPNRAAQSCPLRDAREELSRHVKVVEGMSRLWSRIRDRLKRKGAEFLARGVEESAILAAEGVTNVAFGPIAPIARFLAAAAREALQGKGAQHRGLKEEAERSAGDELCKELGCLMRGSEPLPTIVWLDDAQWIDKSSIEFLEELFRRAKSGEWPLLVIATHWEREWKEDHRDGSEGAPSLARFADPQLDGSPQTEELILQKGDRESLQSLLLARLPGLAADQPERIIRKCDGNFLSLEENIGELLGEERNFENCDFENCDRRTKPLTPKAMEDIEAWESNRDRRVKQRFRALDEETRKILGWSSWTGSRFIGKMIVQFAMTKKVNDPAERISRCIDRYAILAGSEDRPMMEFRDHAYYRTAKKYFCDHLEDDLKDDLEDDKIGLRTFIVNWFSERINCCFDDKKGRIRPTEHAPEFPLLAVPPAQRVELLETIAEFLPLQSILPLQNVDDWSKPLVKSTVRAHFMHMETRVEVKGWSGSRQNLIDELDFGILKISLDPDYGRLFRSIDWMAAPEILGVGWCEDNISLLSRVGCNPWKLVGCFVRHHLGRFETTHEIENLRGVADSLQRLGMIGIHGLSSLSDHRHGLLSLLLSDEELGVLDEPDGIYELLSGMFCGALAIRRQVAKELGTPQSQEDDAEKLLNLSNVEQRRGERKRAYDLLFQVAKELGTPQSQEDVAETLSSLSNVEQRRGDRERAHELLFEAKEIRRQLESMNVAGGVEGVLTARPTAKDQPEVSVDADAHTAAVPKCGFARVSRFFDSNRVSSAVRSRLDGKTFTDATPDAQLPVLRIFQKYGRIHEACSLISSLGNKLSTWEEKETAQLRLIELKLASQRCDFDRVIKDHHSVDKALEQAKLPLRRISAFHRLGVALAVKGNAEGSETAFEQALKLSCKEKQVHAEYTGRMLRSVAQAFRTHRDGQGGLGLTGGVIRTLREAQSQYLKAPTERSLDQADRRKSFVACLFAEAVVLLRCTHAVKAGWYVLGLAHLLGRSAAVRATAEGYAELLGLVDNVWIKELVANAVTPEGGAEGTFLEEFGRTHPDLLHKLQDDIVKIDALDIDSWDEFRCGFHKRLSELGCPK